MSNRYSRRYFVGASAAGAALTARAQTSPSMPRAGVIGVGIRGAHLLKTVLQTDMARVAAVCDNHEGRLKAGLDEAARDKPTGYNDYRRLLDDKSIDAVFIATPCYLHKEMAVNAVEAGKHVYCEKPVAITPAECNEVARAARSSKKVFQVGHQLRASKVYQATLDKIHSGFPGKLLLIKAQRQHESRSVRVAPGKEWFYDRNKSGDIIIENAVHEIDVFNWINGAHPLKACGMGGCNLFQNQPPGRSVTDHYIIVWEYPNGVHVTYTQADYTHNAVGGGRWEHAHFSKMSVDVTNGKFYEPGNQEPVYEVKIDGKDELDAQAVRSFFDCIRNDKKPVADVEVARMAVLTALLGRKAFYEGRTVSWEELGA
ncbi:MAG: Gfo/Idh/MocA family oxidoreductase [Bryobacteraceae bacterium]|nr:Gfo/Idh/MocA family oxidoreductase [Bryobacteraceae bacterium]